MDLPGPGTMLGLLLSDSGFPLLSFSFGVSGVALKTSFLYSGGWGDRGNC